MTSNSRFAGWLVFLLLAACASRPDRFYTLNTLPNTERGPLSTPAIHVLLDVAVPSLVDRAEMVMSTPDNGILILDHERWAASLSDQVAQTLARDIEKRRADVLVADKGFDQAASPPVLIKVDIVRMSAQSHGRATIEAHWRIVDRSTGMDEIGSDRFGAAVGAGYAAVAQAYSEILSTLADRLAGRLRAR